MRISTSDLVSSGGGDEVARRWPDGMEVTEETVREAVELRLSLEWLVSHLMCPVARGAYLDGTDTAESAYREAVAPAERAFSEATYLARHAYREAVAPTQSAYEDATETARRAYLEATAIAERAYQEACIQAFVEASRIHDQEVAG